MSYVRQPFRQALRRFQFAGDKTFLIAAIMATRHARITVFGGAFASLMVMSILSAAMGRVILGLIPAVSQESAF